MGHFFSSVAGPRFKGSAIALLIAGSAFFLFTGLNDSALWDDEAATALFGISVWKTGDAHALLDGNLIAYDDGKELWNLRNRFMPPLPFYVAAPFVGLLDRNARAARLPFAIMGLLTVLLFANRLRSTDHSRLAWMLFTAAILLSTVLFLYFRQCRWYAPVLLFSWCVIFAYLPCAKPKRAMLFAALASVALLASNYMSYIALYGCLMVDYLLWGRKTRPLSRAEWSALILPQVLLGVLLFAFWTPQPLIHQLLNPSPTPGAIGRPELFWMFLREYNADEFGPLIPILAAPVIGLLKKDPWLARGFVFWMTYVVVITVIAPRTEAAAAGMAPVRYLFPLIPLGLFLLVRIMLTVSGKNPVIALLLAPAVFGTNGFHLGPLAGWGRAEPFAHVLPAPSFRSTPIEFIRELVDPPQRTYAAVARWIHDNVAPGETIRAIPGYTAYPLMFHAPHAIYAWQLSPPPTGQFRDLDPVHFMKSRWPDHVIAFGPNILQTGPWLAHNGYRPVDILNVFFYDLTRPELFLRAFRPLDIDLPDDQRVYIFRSPWRIEPRTP